MPFNKTSFKSYLCINKNNLIIKTLPYHKASENSLVDAGMVVTFLAIIYLIMKPYIFYFLFRLT